MWLFIFLLLVLPICNSSPTPSTPATTATTRHYYISAQNVAWDYAPSIKHNSNGRDISDLKTSFNRILYKGYTNESFSDPLLSSPSHGDLGPVIRAEVGDQIIIHFYNNSTQPLTVHAHGVQYMKSNEGIMTQPVQSGDKEIYTWNVLDRSGPPEGKDSTMWAYHSHVSEEDVYKGLIGPLVIYRKGLLETVDPDHEVFVKSIIDHPGERAAMFSINGYIFGNLPTINMTLGDTYTWYLLSFGDEEDIHAMHWHGNVVKTYTNQYVDVVHLFPASFETVVLVPDTIGVWMYHCHVIEHFDRGMYAFYSVT